jgi:hypothetical protein
MCNFPAKGSYENAYFIGFFPAFTFVVNTPAFWTSNFEL